MFWLEIVDLSAHKWCIQMMKWRIHKLWDMVAKTHIRLDREVVKLEYGGPLKAFQVKNAPNIENNVSTKTISQKCGGKGNISTH